MTSTGPVGEPSRSRLRLSKEQLIYSPICRFYETRLGRAMSQQASFSDLEYTNKKRRTRRELFLAEMETVVPWRELLGVIEPHYPRAGGRGRPPVGLAAMLRIYFLQNGWPCRTVRWRMHSTTWRACAGLRVFPMSRPRCPTRQRSSTFATSWSSTICRRACSRE